MAQYSLWVQGKPNIAREGSALEFDWDNRNVSSGGEANRRCVPPMAWWPSRLPGLFRPRDDGRANRRAHITSHMSGSLVAVHLGLKEDFGISSAIWSAFWTDYAPCDEPETSHMRGGLHERVDVVLES